MKAIAYFDSVLQRQLIQGICGLRCAILAKLDLPAALRVEFYS